MISLALNIVAVLFLVWLAIILLGGIAITIGAMMAWYDRTRLGQWLNNRGKK